MPEKVERILYRRCEHLHGWVEVSDSGSLRIGCQDAEKLCKTTKCSQKDSQLSVVILETVSTQRSLKLHIGWLRSCQQVSRNGSFRNTTPESRASDFGLLPWLLLPHWAKDEATLQDRGCPAWPGILSTPHERVLYASFKQVQIYGRPPKNRACPRRS